MKMARKIVVIGMNGATWDLLKLSEVDEEYTTPQV